MLAIPVQESNFDLDLTLYGVQHRRALFIHTHH